MCNILCLPSQYHAEYFLCPKHSLFFTYSSLRLPKSLTTTDLGAYTLNAQCPCQLANTPFPEPETDHSFLIPSWAGVNNKGRRACPSPGGVIALPSPREHSKNSNVYPSGCYIYEKEKPLQVVTITESLILILGNSV